MATALLDLLPEVIESFSQIVPHAKFPIPEFVIAFGFFIILVVEQIALFYKEEVIDTMNPIQRLGSRDRDLNERSTLRSQIGVPVFSDELRPAPRDELLSPHVGVGVRDDTPTQWGGDHSSFRSVLMFVSLSLHSLFEGLAIGIQSDLDTVLQVAIAVIIHKVIIGFSVGLKLIQSELSVKSVAQLDFWFSIMSPLGIGIAVGIETMEKNMDKLLLMTGIMQGLATGTFFYVTFIEVIPKEIQSGRNRLLKLLAIIVGFVTVCVVIYVDNQNRAPSTPGS
uniref:Zinc transporter ZIP1 n=1 Tax=Cacopsylla melanoneura TaxID=428564 RepID=A0A8D8YK35_9HEMI